MAITFDVIPNEFLIFTAPSVTITAVDTTPAASGINSWCWYFNNTLVSQASTWVCNFFAPTEGNLILVANSIQSETAEIAIVERATDVVDFLVCPANGTNWEAPSLSIVATDNTPNSVAVSSWEWYFNNVLVSTTSSWEQKFFTPITGYLEMRVNSPYLTGQTSAGPTLLSFLEFNACRDHESTLPTGHRGSTTLNPIITSYDLLAERIKMQLGWPIVDVEACDEMIFDAIDQAIEWYSKYAGYTEEYLCFDSYQYECGQGIPMDKVLTCVSKCYCPDGTGCGTTNRHLTAMFMDCDLNEYRKVIDVKSFEPVDFSGTDYLFSLDYMFAQQTYFSYLLGNIGYDLITWQALKMWLDLREKMFATKPQIRFDERTQRMRIIPEPTQNNNRYVGVVGCTVERPIKDMVRERWVFQYASAIVKIMVGNVRGKFGSVNLLGGAAVNYNDIRSQGLEEKKQLEEEILRSFGEVQPLGFLVG